MTEETNIHMIELLIIVQLIGPFLSQIQKNEKLYISKAIQETETEESIKTELVTIFRDSSSISHLLYKYRSKVVDVYYQKNEEADKNLLKKLEELLGYSEITEQPKVVKTLTFPSADEAA